MKILFITHYSEMYGANISLLQLMKELKENYGVKPIILIPKRGKIEEELKKNKIDYILLRFYPWVCPEKYSKFGIYGLKFLNYFNLISINKLKKNILLKDLNLVHTNSSVINIGAYISKKLELLHVWHIREYGKEDYNLNYIYSKKKVANLYNSSAKVIAISNSIKHKYENLIEKKKIEVIYNGISSEVYKCVDKKEKQILNICFVGLLKESKNQMEALKAILVFKKKKEDMNFILNIIGSGKPKYEKKLKNFVKINKLEKNVKFYGYQKEVNEILNIMDMALVCSKKEAFGRVTVEYMLKKIPVIASNTGANTELIMDGETGLIYNYGDAKDLYYKIKELLENKKIRKKISINAFKRANENYTSKINARNIYKMYKTLNLQSKQKELEI